jgi:branched-chain amino acid transport system ATP-binding protein
MESLIVKQITKRFGGVVANENVSLSIRDGEIVSIIGPNGAGKTTLFNMITGVDRPDSGSVQFNGRDITSLDTPEIAELGLIRTFQQTKIFRDLSVLEAVMTGTHLHDRTTFLGAIVGSSHARSEKLRSREDAMEVIRFLGMEARHATTTQNLPYGEQKLLNIAIALAAKPKMLLLDEPAAGINPSEAKHLMNTIYRIKDSGVTIGLVEHNMRLVMNISGRVFVLNYGELIAEGTPEEIRSDSKVIEVYLGRHKSA